MGKLEGRVAVVTGGSKGIGAYVVREYAREGAKLCINYSSDSSREPAKRLADEINAAGGEAFCFQCDVSQPEPVREMFSQTARRFGGVDILVNNAGIAVFGTIEEMSYEQIDRMLRVDLFSLFVTIKEAFPYLVKSPYGRIINTSSQIPQKGAAELSAYAAAKAGVFGLTRSLAREFGMQGMKTNILINTVAPGSVSCGMGLAEVSDPEWVAAQNATVPLGRQVTPEEVVPCFVFLASDASSGFMGQTLSPNGGDTMVY